MIITRSITARSGAVALALASTVTLGAQTQTPQSSSQTPSGANASTVTRSTTSPDYRLTPGDKLRVEVYKDAQLSQSLQIRPDGKVTLPLVGDIVAAELTPIQLRDRITTSLKEYVTNPVVTVIVVEASPVNVFVMGEVLQPGAVPMRGPMTVLQALAMAGGFREFANTKDIKIQRRVGNQPSVQTLHFNYNDAVKGNAAPVFLQPGDMVIVP